MKFKNQLKKELNEKRTENLDKTYHSSLDNCLDFFALGGATRNTTGDNILSMFYKAYNENPKTALKTLFYIRDVRGGQGERRIFRIITQDLATNNDENLKKLLDLIPKYGRWDDLIRLVKTPYREKIKTILDNQLADDLNNPNPSLLGKWMPSSNTSSDKAKELAREIMDLLGIDEEMYRQMLSSLREKLEVTEKLMSENRWEEIDFENISSKAHMIYREAFERHCPERYSEYIAEVEEGDKDIKSGTLYPYELYDKVMDNSVDKTLDEQWNNLPNYVDEDSNALVVADVSGSMTGRPMSVSVSLALYFAERNNGEFSDTFMTFSKKPQLVEVTGDNLKYKLESIERSNWGMNTDLDAVFDKILDTAVENDVPSENLPNPIYIITDMQFDMCINNADKTLFERKKQKFKENGYELPTVVFWNVDDRNNHTLPATKFDGNVSMVSGFSPVIFEFAVKNKSASEVMNTILSRDRYEEISSRLEK